MAVAATVSPAFQAIPLEVSEEGGDTCSVTNGASGIAADAEGETCETASDEALALSAKSAYEVDPAPLLGQGS
jgi:hypothetical protein